MVLVLRCARLTLRPVQALCVAAVVPHPAVQAAVPVATEPDCVLRPLVGQMSPDACRRDGRLEDAEVCLGPGHRQASPSGAQVLRQLAFCEADQLIRLCARAAQPLMLAAPLLLRDGPADHPICEAGAAVELRQRLGGGQAPLHLGARILMRRRRCCGRRRRCPGRRQLLDWQLQQPRRICQLAHDTEFLVGVPVVHLAIQQHAEVGLILLAARGAWLSRGPGEAGDFRAIVPLPAALDTIPSAADPHGVLGPLHFHLACGEGRVDCLLQICEQLGGLGHRQLPVLPAGAAGLVRRVEPDEDVRALRGARRSARRVLDPCLAADAIHEWVEALTAPARSVAAVPARAVVPVRVQDDDRAPHVSVAPILRLRECAELALAHAFTAVRVDAELARGEFAIVRHVPAACRVVGAANLGPPRRRGRPLGIPLDPRGVLQVTRQV
mmetsp:Transcript_64487/g.165927  ORF Transcript_64487/g.165927 Transcript_64487/m.165927 type:complete len:440 (+) Transcript_64487:291-1610(+)